MANDCDFKIRITGNSDNLENFHKKLEETLAGESLISQSDYTKVLTEEIDIDWGSKWQVFRDIDFDGEDITLDGYSAWGPALGFWQVVSEDYEFEIELGYSEPGMDFAGVIQWNCGEEVSHLETSYFNYLYRRDINYFWEEVKDRSEWQTLEELKESFSDWETLSDSEKYEIEEIFYSKS